MSEYRPIYFNPDGEGLEVFLGPTEARAMTIIWAEGDSTVKNVLFHWPDKRRPAYNTVQTILTKLTDKGLLTRQRHGRHFIYTATGSREQYIQAQLKLVTDCLKRNFSKQFKKTAG